MRRFVVFSFFPNHTRTGDTRMPDIEHTTNSTETSFSSCSLVCRQGAVSCIACLHPAVEALGIPWKQWCKEGNIAYSRRWHAAHREEQNMLRIQRRNTHLEEERARDRKRYADDPDGRKQIGKADRIAHPEKFRIRHQQWRRDNPEKAREHGRISTMRHRSRMRQLPTTFTQEDANFALQYWSDGCAVCGAKKGFWIGLAFDHWIPVSSPNCPGTVAENMLVLCQAIKGAPFGTPCCNQSKHKKMQKYGSQKNLGNAKRGKS
jgi:hypothetical protein